MLLTGVGLVAVSVLLGRIKPGSWPNGLKLSPNPLLYQRFDYL